ncbi:MAG: cryptochrome/photolyase family protein, partial [Solirubrobacterales bacterium]|nr:cryptochrome/photolyase family protein [Solirubrobacterales bacterium]
MEFFYRRMRTEHNLLLDSGGAPEGGKWNLDSENRRPPKDGLSPPQPWLPTEDEIDAEVRADLNTFETEHGVAMWGNGAPREFAVTATEAKAVLDDFIANRLAGFGPWQDAMVPGEDTMFHSRISVPLNLGLLDPLEACRAAEAAYRAGAVPLQSAEGFIRQIIGWREFVRCMYRLREGEWETDNALGASLPLPPAFHDPSATDWQCLSSTIEIVDRTGYAHHIERLMVLGNSILLLGVEPGEALAWFRESFVDAADWVMAPNVLGMGIHADGGVMMTKPYAAGGNYMNRMSRHCGSCRYDPKQRKGENACPLTAMYWEFLDRHRERFAANPRMSLAIRNLERIDPAELEQVRETAEAARRRIARGAP